MGVEIEIRTEDSASVRRTPKSTTVLGLVRDQ